MNIDFAIGLHIAGFLASQDGRPLKSEVMASTFGTSPVVLRRVLTRLNRAGIVASKRGSNGGSVLSRDPSEINLLEIYQAANSKTELFRRHPEPEGAVSSVLGSYINGFYDEAERKLFEKLRNTSVADMDSEVREKIKKKMGC